MAVFFYPVVELQAIAKRVPVTHDEHHLLGKGVGGVNEPLPLVNPVPEEPLVNKDIVRPSADCREDVVRGGGATGAADRQVVVVAAGLGRCSRVLVGSSSFQRDLNPSRSKDGEERHEGLAG